MNIYPRGLKIPNMLLIQMKISMQDYLLFECDQSKFKLKVSLIVADSKSLLRGDIGTNSDKVILNLPLFSKITEKKSEEKEAENDLDNIVTETDFEKNHRNRN